MIGCEIDIWALGVFLYEISVGYHPSKVTPNAQKKMNVQYCFRDKDWNKKSIEIKDLVKACLKRDPERDQLLTVSYNINGLNFDINSEVLRI